MLTFNAIFQSCLRHAILPKRHDVNDYMIDRYIEPMNKTIAVATMFFLSLSLAHPLAGKMPLYSSIMSLTLNANYAHINAHPVSNLYVSFTWTICVDVCLDIPMVQYIMLGGGNIFMSGKNLWDKKAISLYMVCVKRQFYFRSFFWNPVETINLTSKVCVWDNGGSYHKISFTI